MKRSILLCSLLCALLCSCQTAPDTQSPVDEEQNETVNHDQTDKTDAEAQTRLAYYESLVGNLQAEILDLKASLFSERVEYEARIDALETELKAMGDGNEGSTSNPNEEAGNSPSETDERLFRYTVSNGEAVLTAYLGDASEVLIPATLGGCPVVAVGDRAFLNQTSLTSVTLPKGVREIGWFAFSGCIALERVEIPSNVRAIAYGAFQNCSDTLTVVCHVGSYAEAYAQSYGMRILRQS
ncbi:MAG: leucine-rich repeat domain-containing protein [Clostridia bacterium]|nr:leucine-rich repeat domain-containing protein [Clostridia bacterium]